jgi:hypothetical protein
VAHYPFDGNASDMSGNGNHGVPTNVLPSSGRQGIPNSAYAFNGEVSVVTVPHDEVFNFPQNQNFSIGLWALLNYSQSDNHVVYFVSKDNAGGPNPKWIFGTAPTVDYPSDRRMFFHFNNPPSTGHWLADDQPFVLNPSTWNHYLLTKSGSTYTVYLDGNQFSSETSSSQIPNGITAPLTIGSAENSTFDGKMDEVRIYNRALSAADVAGLYELERPKDSDSDGLFDTYETYLGTDPNVADTDGDGLNDGQEVTAGTDPKISDKTVIDAVKANSANFGLVPLTSLTATGATPHTNGWYYQPEWGWVWTNANVFPYVYRSPLGGKQAGWLYFREGSAPPYFHDYATGTWTKVGE